MQNQTNPTNPVPYMIEREIVEPKLQSCKSKEEGQTIPLFFEENIAMPCKIENRHMAQTNDSSEEKTSEQADSDRSITPPLHPCYRPSYTKTQCNQHPSITTHIKSKTRAGNKTYGIYFTPESSKLEIISSGSCSPTHY